MFRKTLGTSNINDFIVAATEELEKFDKRVERLGFMTFDEQDWAQYNVVKHFYQLLTK